MAYVFGEMLVWLLIAVVGTALVCWLLWRWRVNRIPYEEWAAMEVRSSVEPEPVGGESNDEAALEDLRAQVRSAEASNEELRGVLSNLHAELEEARAEVVAEPGRGRRRAEQMVLQIEYGSTQFGA